jgi:hypothetical protein
MQRTFADLRPGDSVYTSSGSVAGSISYKQGDGTVWLDIDGRTIRLDARNASKPVVKLGSSLLFTEKNRQPTREPHD